MDKQLQDLQNKITAQKDIIDSQAKELETIKREVGEFKALFKVHAHSGTDGSKMLSSRIKMKSGEELEIGDTVFGSITGATDDPNTQRGYVIVGSDKEIGDGSDNAQLIIEHQPQTNGTANQTFIYSNRGPLYTGTAGEITSGGTTFTTSRASFPVNSLDGAHILVRDSANAGQFDMFEIASNTNSKITITGGTWTFSDDSAEWVIFTPTYLGSADYPWRRGYVMDGTTGGLRIGPGDTNGGQNGLLYMDSAGDLYWRNKSGTSTKLN